jgi:hypothetical protein
VRDERNALFCGAKLRSEMDIAGLWLSANMRQKSIPLFHQMDDEMWLYARQKSAFYYYDDGGGRFLTSPIDSVYNAMTINIGHLGLFID